MIKTVSLLLLIKNRVPGLTQSAKCLTLDFSSGHDFRVVKSSSALGFVLGIEPA